MQKEQERPDNMRDIYKVNGECQIWNELQDDKQVYDLIFQSRSVAIDHLSDESDPDPLPTCTADCRQCMLALTWIPLMFKGVE